MKRILSLTLAVLMLAALALPTLAAENEFVPSITEKDAPEIVPVKDPASGSDALGVICDNEGNDVTDYVTTLDLVVTPVSKVDTSTAIPEEAAEELKEVYTALTDGTMKLPLEKLGDDIKAEEMVIRDLFSVAWVNEDMETEVNKPGVCTKITFRLNVKAADEVYCMTYHNGQWDPVEKVTNNGDGTVTCLFEQKCPVAFIVRTAESSPKDGDVMGNYMGLWVGLLVASAAALVAVVVVGKNRKTR